MAHYLRPAGSTKLPRSHTVLDVESQTEHRNGTFQQHWRLACADHFHGHNARKWSDPVSVIYRQPWELWSDLHSKVKPERRHIVWCHNLAYDLRVSGALTYLPAMGYELEGIALEHVAGWARFALGSASLLFVDLCSWLPAPLAKVAEDLGIRAVVRPADDAPESAHVARCQSDVTIARRAIIELLDLVSEYDLGPWRPTGAGQSHSAWRRRWLTHKCLVHDQLAVLTAERAAAWTGRCEAWRHGPLDDGPYVEFDLSLAYCQIAADSHIPSMLIGATHTLDVAKLVDLSATHAVLARVSVATDSECLPAMGDEHIFWPVGEFDTVLWDPELAMAAAAGAHLVVREAWIYRKAPALKEASEWIVSALSHGTDALTRVQLRLLKHWARAMVGRCALRYRTWEKWGEAETEDVTLGMYHDWDTGDVSEMMQVGHQLRVLTEQRESPDSMPQIPGWIMSECRRRLWTLMQTAGADHVIYVDTDSLIVDHLGARRLRNAAARGEGWPLHVKGTYRQLDIHGPRMLEVDGQRRMSGIPLQARADQNGKLAGQVFLSLRESMMRHQLDSVEVLNRTYEVANTDRRRLHVDGGRTRPHAVSKAS